MEINHKLIALHTHWCIADSVKYAISHHNYVDNSKLENAFIQMAIRQSTFYRLSVWYALIYVVVEGYSELEIKNKQIDELLNSDYVDKLRLFRNATFHFQNNPINEKLLGFLEQKDSEIWIKQLHKAFEDYFTSIFPIKEIEDMINEE